MIFNKRRESTQKELVQSDIGAVVGVAFPLMMGMASNVSLFVMCPSVPGSCSQLIADWSISTPSANKSLFRLDTFCLRTRVSRSQQPLIAEYTTATSMADLLRSRSCSPTAVMAANAEPRTQTELSQHSHATKLAASSRQPIMIESWRMPKVCAPDWRASINSLAVTPKDGALDAAAIQSLAPMTMREEALTCMALFLVLGFMIWGVPTITIFSYFYPSAGALVVSVLLCSSLAEAKYWKDTLRSSLAQLLLKYFSLRIIWKTELDATRQYIFVAPPHGAFPFGNVCSAIAFPTFAGLSVRSLAATAVVRYPIIRQLMAWIGAIDASRDNAYRALLEGESIGICPGGIAEIFETNLATESLIMRRRKGMIRLALKTGVPLVPCYMFGNSTVLHTYFDPWDIMHTVSMTTKVSMFAFWGRWGLPIPFRIPLLAVVGEPIPVPIDPSCNEALVDKIHQQLLDAIEALFEEHKALYGWPDKQLVIN